ncbi:MAG TPA: tetratricopeptide repeat protein [Polyangia bacterium]|nr:tetratricopeptide repeat protein [Polyangia bacterium]
MCSFAIGFALIGPAACGGSGTPAARSAGSSDDARPVASASLGDSALGPAAEEALKAEDWPRAESTNRELARRQPRNPAGKRGLGLALMKQGKNDQAVEALQGSLEIADDAHTQLLLAEALVGVGRAPSALPHVRKAVKMVPAEPGAWAQLADVLVKVEKPDGAADALLESRKPCPACAKDEAWGRAADTVAEALCAKAEKQLASNDANGARKSVEAAAALRPERAETHLLEAKVANAGGDKKAAAVAYRKAVDGLSDASSDAGASARVELAALLVSDGDGASAAKLAREVVAVRGSDGRALDLLGRACDLTKDTDCSRKSYDKLAKLSPGTTAPKETIDHARQRLKELKKKKRR